ncbi:MAG: hypothetical protein C4575_00730 [Desulforudis sp.]|jgi:hypothetical protein|nr:MAG: hypothetical protein C4575_00730 [Desulforudis sp.]
MGNSEGLSKAERDIPILRSFVCRLLDLSSEILKSPIRYQESDHLAFMALCFVGAQVEHLTTINILVAARQYKDAEIIARIMIEGMCLLLWAAKDPEDRPLLWRSYAYVQDFQLMQDKEKAGEEIDPVSKSQIIEQLSIYGHSFEKKKYKEGEFPYRGKWLRESVREVCEEINATPHYEIIYRETSQWIHWTPRGLGTAIHREGDLAGFLPNSEDAAATALANGFQALYESLILLDRILELGFTNQLDTLNKVYIERMST